MFFYSTSFPTESNHSSAQRIDDLESISGMESKLCEIYVKYIRDGI